MSANDKIKSVILSGDEECLHDAVHVAGVAEVEEADLAHGRVCRDGRHAHVTRTPRSQLQEPAAARRHVPLQARYLQSYY